MPTRSTRRPRSTRPSPQARHPRGDEVRALRESRGLTQAEAAALIHGSTRSWQDYEGGQRKMHPGLWELFRIKSAR